MSRVRKMGIFAPDSARKGTDMALAMQRLSAISSITPAGTRLRVRHTFRSAEKAALEVIYAFGLPRDAALRRFHIKGEGFSVTSDLKPVDEARKAYEQGLADGRTAALAQQYGDGRVNLTVGNIRPGRGSDRGASRSWPVWRSRDDGFRFRFPFTLAPAYHARARGGRGTGPGWGRSSSPPMSSATSSYPAPRRRLLTPRSGIRFDRDYARRDWRNGLALARHPGDRPGAQPQPHLAGHGGLDIFPNRDLVLDIQAKETPNGILSGTGRDGKGHFAAIVCFRNISRCVPVPSRASLAASSSSSTTRDRWRGRRSSRRASPSRPAWALSVGTTASA